MVSKRPLPAGAIASGSAMIDSARGKHFPGVSSLLGSCLLFVSFALPLVFTGPLQIFSSSQDDFSNGFLDLLPRSVLPFGIAFCIYIAVMSSVPIALRVRLVALGIAFGILLYLQGNILLYDYGVLDGSEIDWQLYKSRGVVDSVLWVALPILSLTFSKSIARKASTIAFFLVLMSLGNIGSIAFSQKIKWRALPGVVNDAAFYSFSQERNVIVILLDAFQSPFFDQALRLNPQYKSMFKDFTFYRNTSTHFPTTAPSVPSILSGQLYDNSEPMSTFLDRVLSKDSLPVLLARSGLHADVVSLPQFCTRLPGVNCSTLAALASKDLLGLKNREAGTLIDAALFRYAPQPIKSLIYSPGGSVAEGFVGKKRKSRIPPTHADSIKFVQKISTESNTSANQQVFKFFHLLIPHAPQVLNRTCGLAVNINVRSRDKAMEQARCALFLTQKIIDMLRRVNIYDQSMIIVLADHGSGTKVMEFATREGFPHVQHAMPLLLIKPFEHSGETITTSNVQAQLSDIPRTVSEALQLTSDFPGTSVLKLGSELRERHFFLYHWEHKYWRVDYMPRMSEFIIEGEVSDPARWRVGRTLESGGNH